MDKERYITYLSYYEKKEKRQNVGFAKIEFTPEQTRMEIRLKPMSFERKEGKIYFLNEKGVEEEFLEEMSFASGKQFQMNRQRFDETKGFMIPIGEDSFIAGTWRKTEYSIEELQVPGVVMEEELEQQSLPWREESSTQVGGLQEENVDNIFKMEKESEQVEEDELEAVCVNRVRKNCPLEMMAAFLELWRLMDEGGHSGSDLPTSR